jgi:hypothetical protein
MKKAMILICSVLFAISFAGLSFAGNIEGTIVYVEYNSDATHPGGYGTGSIGIRLAPTGGGANVSCIVWTGSESTDKIFLAVALTAQASGSTVDMYKNYSLSPSAWTRMKVK